MYGGPVLSLAHLNKRRQIAFADGDIEFLHRSLLVLCREVHLIGCSNGAHRGIVAALIYIYKGVGVHCHLLGLCRSRDVHFVGAGQVSPLGLAVEPHLGLRSVGKELVSLDCYCSADRALLASVELERCRSTALATDSGSGLVENLLCRLTESRQRNGYHGYKKPQLCCFHNLVIVVLVYGLDFTVGYKFNSQLRNAL